MDFLVIIIKNLIFALAVICLVPVVFYKSYIKPLMEVGSCAGCHKTKSCGGKINKSKIVNKYKGGD